MSKYFLKSKAVKATLDYIKMFNTWNIPFLMRLIPIYKLG